ncbi:hypothetical protein [Mycobacterium sp. TY814]|uniref:hypothetical protein n=1 Tax=Mycobacterium sp. TY814 TaxID=3050580 RepID=UPI00274233DE|nr:hypothetical protein [Mycobacterium sp. TY814]MDP7721813.1 hypothetical protein [Mycobacterium sp. TY814]
MSTRDEQNARYRQGLCCVCGLVPYSAGRVRCDDCHRAHVTPYEPGLTRREEAQRGA